MSDQPVFDSEVQPFLKEEGENAHEIASTTNEPVQPLSVPIPVESPCFTPGKHVSFSPLPPTPNSEHGTPTISRTLSRSNSNIDNTLVAPVQLKEIFRSFLDKLMQWAVPTMDPLIKQHKMTEFILVAAAITIVFTLISLTLASFYKSLDTQVSVATLKKFLDSLEAQNMSEVSLRDISEAAAGGVVRKIVKNFQLFFEWTVIVSVGFITNIISPIFGLYTTFNVGELIQDSRKKAEVEEKHKKKLFEEEVIIGWNIFLRRKDAAGNVIGMDFIIPTESQCQLPTMLRYDEKLYEKALKQVCAKYVPRNDSNCPDFMVVLDPADQIELVRAGTNTISSTQLKHAEKARLSKANPNDGENPIFIFTCEKDAPRVHTRIWLIFPSELKMLLELEKAGKISDPTFMFVHKDNWRDRIRALLAWAHAEFDENGKRVGGNRLYKSEIMWI
jgi:hypothetical protein